MIYFADNDSVLLLSRILNAGLLLVMEYFYIVVLVLLLK